MWLSSELLGGGLRVIDSTRDEEKAIAADLDGIISGSKRFTSHSGTTPSLSTLVDSCDDASVLSLGDRVVPLLADVPIGPTLVPAEVEDAVARCIRHVFAALLHHGDLVAAAESFADDGGAGPPPLDVQRAWKAANVFRRSIVTLYQAETMRIFNSLANAKQRAKEEAARTGAAHGTEEAKAEEQQRAAVDAGDAAPDADTGAGQPPTPAAGVLDTAGDDEELSEVNIDRVAVYGKVCADVEERCRLLLCFHAVTRCELPPPSPGMSGWC